MGKKLVCLLLFVTMMLQMSVGIGVAEFQDSLDEIQAQIDEACVLLLGKFGVTEENARRVYEQGDEHADISEIKYLLQVWGYYGKNETLDNVFDEKMAEYVKAFQRDNNLEVTGKVDLMTKVQLYLVSESSTDVSEEQPSQTKKTGKKDYAAARPEGLEVLKAGVCELDENGDWVRGRGNEVSLANLPEGHVYGFYIELANTSNRTLQFNMRVYKNDMPCTNSSATEIKPNWKYTIFFYPSSENTVGKDLYGWYIDGECAFEKTLEITE